MLPKRSHAFSCAGCLSVLRSRVLRVSTNALIPFVEIYIAARIIGFDPNSVILGSLAFYVLNMALYRHNLIVMPRMLRALGGRRTSSLRDRALRYVRKVAAGYFIGGSALLALAAIAVDAELDAAVALGILLAANINTAVLKWTGQFGRRGLSLSAAFILVVYVPGALLPVATTHPAFLEGARLALFALLVYGTLSDLRVCNNSGASFNIWFDLREELSPRVLATRLAPVVLHSSDKVIIAWLWPGALVAYDFVLRVVNFVAAQGEVLIYSGYRRSNLLCAGMLSAMAVGLGAGIFLGIISFDYSYLWLMLLATLSTIINLETYLQAPSLSYIVNSQLPAVAGVLAILMVCSLARLPVQAFLWGRCGYYLYLIGYAMPHRRRLEKAANVRADSNGEQRES